MKKKILNPFPYVVIIRIVILCEHVVISSSNVILVKNILLCRIKIYKVDLYIRDIMLTDLIKWYNHV